MFQDDQQAAPGCWSEVGRQGGFQIIQLSDIRCYTKAKITHEIYHSIGFYHEHTRMDRDQYVEVHLGCIRDSLEKNFKVQPNTESFGVPYDAKSIMHYKPSQGAINTNCKTITSKVNLH